MIFKCHCGHDVFITYNDASQGFACEFVSLVDSYKEDPPINWWFARCEGCRKYWGPYYELEDLQRGMLKDGVLK